MEYCIAVNGTERLIEAESETPLLWVLRDHCGLTGTKFGCGKGLCGACSVHLSGTLVRSCVLPVSAVGDAPVRTIEGLGEGGLSKLQQAWLDEQVAQCGYCQAGMLMAADALLKRVPKPSDAEIDEAMTNLCRCGTYTRVRRAIRVAAGID